MELFMLADDEMPNPMRLKLRQLRARLVKEFLDFDQDDINQFYETDE